jgi:hypothetical protein
MGQWLNTQGRNKYFTGPQPNYGDHRVNKKLKTRWSKTYVDEAYENCLLVRVGRLKRISRFLLGLLYDHEDGDIKFLRNFRLSRKYCGI